MTTNGYILKVNPFTHNFKVNAWKPSWDDLPLDVIYETIGFDIFDVCKVEFENQIIMAFVDDMGYHRTPVPPAFSFFDYPQPLVGKALVAGFNRHTGQSQPLRFDLFDMLDNIKFIKPMNGVKQQ